MTSLSLLVETFLKSRPLGNGLQGRRKIAQLLLRNGANGYIWAKNIHVHYNNLDARGFSFTTGHEDVIRVLVNHGFFNKKIRRAQG
ncbi:predicted protein [Sclerotinia sclerotiorum 1980 UF-70]|uniref:Uncharacterized protein n=1 Tax=Sclerotinia sclerotiorum (strain ATCC 18683 / 1980 / Ss-1) TaxID=665079 RepID=A7EBE2_SCLS1|nr:predicted protein [Sclerotinia sclerotiorum 1980 UF-70]EDN99770.1 predicted protein [Sclerotinia sclerotiorum 1980 UF-70]